MKKNTTKTTNIPESNGEQQTSYQKLLKKLDHKGFARNYYNNQLDRAKMLVFGIIGMTSGVYAIDDKTRGENNLLELLEMFQVRHENFSCSSLAEDLQLYIFGYTMTHSNAYHEWRKSVFAERYLDENGVQIEALQDDEVPDVEPESVPLELSDAKDLAFALSGILKNPLLPVQLYNVITDEISLIGDNDTPENILFNFERMNKKEGAE